MRYVGDNINAFRENRGISQEHLAEKLDVRQSTVSSWECGKFLPQMGAIEKMHDEFGLSYDDILSEALGFARRRSQRPFSKDGARRAMPEDSPTAPILGKIAAGTPDEMLGSDESFYVPAALKQRFPRAFYLKVRGNSMNRTMPDGCLALVDPDQREPNRHDAFAVQVGADEATVKRLRKTENGIELVPDSFDPAFAPIVFVNGPNAKPVRVLGKVVWVTTPFEYRP